MIKNFMQCLTTVGIMILREKELMQGSMQLWTENGLMENLIAISCNAKVEATTIL